MEALDAVIAYRRIPWPFKNITCSITLPTTFRNPHVKGPIGWANIGPRCILCTTVVINSRGKCHKNVIEAIICFAMNIITEYIYIRIASSYHDIIWSEVRQNCITWCVTKYFDTRRKRSVKCNDIYLRCLHVYIYF